MREGKLSANVVNKTLTRLAQVLEVAVEYGYLDRNPARGRQRRLKATKPKRTWLEPEQVAPLLDAAGAIDADRRSDDPGGRRAMPATLILAGLRIGELIALRWRDIDLASGRLTVGEARRTPAGAPWTSPPPFATSLPPTRRAPATPPHETPVPDADGQAA